MGLRALAPNEYRYEYYVCSSSGPCTRYDSATKDTLSSCTELTRYALDEHPDYFDRIYDYSTYTYEYEYHYF